MKQGPPSNSKSSPFQGEMPSSARRRGPTRVNPPASVVARQSGSDPVNQADRGKVHADELVNAPISDRDGDGDPDSTDCAPEDSAVHDGAEELCNGIDDDCDGEVDETTSPFQLKVLPLSGGGAELSEAEGAHKSESAGQCGHASDRKRRQQSPAQSEPWRRTLLW